MSESETLQGLDSASQKHEKEIVIDLAPDRILHFLGVYVIVLLALITKVTELAGQGRLSCFPINQNKSDLTFIKHANAYCWESGELQGIEAHQNLSACRKFIKENKTDLISNRTSYGSSSSIRRFLQWMPYGMLLEAFLFALPMAYWHFMVGARLIGHLKFMQLLLQDIYKSVKTIPAGIYRKEPYDMDGLSLNCWRKYKLKKSDGRIQEDADTAQGGTQPQVSEHPHGSTLSLRGETASPSLNANESKENQDGGTEDLASSGEKNEQKEEASSTTRNTQENQESEEASLPPTDDSEKAKLLNDLDEEVRSNTPTTSTQLEVVKLDMKKVMPIKKLTEGTNQTKYSTTKFSEDKRASKTQEHRSTETISAASDVISGSDDNESDNSGMKKVLQKVTNPNFEDEHDKLRKRRGSNNPNSEDELEGKGNGKLSDRHIFSMICYENFASLQHLPYLKSVEKLVAVPAFEKDVDLLKENREAILPMKYAILRRFCDADNFKSHFVVGVYKRKCFFSIALSALITVGITTLITLVILPTFWSGSSLCGVPHHGECLSCTLTGLIDVYAAFFANWIAVVIYFIVAVVQLNFVLNASDHALSHFLDDVKPLCGVALAAAHQVGKDNPKDSE